MAVLTIRGAIQRWQSAAFYVPPFADTSITKTIIGRAIQVHRTLGPGLFEKTYEECLSFELRKAGLLVEQQKQLPLIYETLELRNAYRIDLLVEKHVIVEIKTTEKLSPLHITQVLTYLRFSGLEVGMIINFNSTILRHGIKRIFNKREPSSGISVRPSGVS